MITLEWFPISVSGYPIIVQSYQMLETSLGKHEIGPADPSSFILSFPEGGNSAV